MKKKISRLAAVMLAFAVAFTMMPTMTGTLDAHAASYIKTLNTSAAGQNAVNLSWTKLSKKQQKKVHGITIFRHGQAVANLSKKAGSYTDAGLAAGTTYTYQVKTYTKKIKKTKMWKNKATGALQKKAPSKKQKKNFKKVTVKNTTYKYSNASPARSVRTASAPAPTPAPAPSTPTTPSVPSSGGGTGGDDGGNSGGQTQNPRTAYNCVDYLGESHTLWRDTNGKIYDSQTGGSVVSNPAMYDKTVDGSWSAQNSSSWKKNGNFYQKNGVTLNYLTDTSVNVFNGSASKIKFEIVEETKAFKFGYRNDTTGPVEYMDINCVMIGEDRLCTYDTYTGTDYSSLYFTIGTADDIYGFDGYIDGTVHANAYYDFNGDGKWTTDEKITASPLTRDIKKSTRTAKALEIAKAAIKDAADNPDAYADIFAYNLPDYQTDILIIQHYMLSHYNYYTDSNIDGSGLNARCNGGANVLKVWSAYKYHVYGFVGCAPGGDDHVAFYPGIDGVNKGYVSRDTVYYEANGAMVR